MDLWDRSTRLLAERRAAAGPSAFSTLAERATRMASIDTGAIEGLYAVDRGFTVTVASMASEWQAQILREKGPDVAALVTAQRAAYDMALDAATRHIEMTEVWIRQLHEVVCRAQEAYDVQTAIGPQRHLLQKGEYKRVPNHVELADGSTHEYAPVEDTPAEMQRLVEELRTPLFQRAHPALQSSYAHDALVCVHPFSDGNGRVARALASVFTFRSTSLPFVLFADQKDAYLAALGEADDSHGQAFVDFLLLRCVDLQQLVAEQLAEAAGTSIEEAASRLGALTSYPESRRVLDSIGMAAEAELSAADLPESIGWEVVVTDTLETLGPQRDLGIRVLVRMFSPRTIRIEEFLTVRAGAEIGGIPLLMATRVRRPEDTLEIRLDEVRPMMKSSLETRIRSWVRRALAELLQHLAAEAQGTY